MPDESTTLAQLRRLMADFVAERDWEIYHDAKNLSMAIAIEAAELMECFQWVRNEELAALTRKADVRAQITGRFAFARATRDNPRTYAHTRVYPHVHPAVEVELCEQQRLSAVSPFCLWPARRRRVRS